MVLVALWSAVGLAHRAGATASSSVGVTETEYRITLGRTTVPHGRITFYIANFGQDDHDLQLQRVGGTRVWDIPKTLPGQRQTITLKLRPGLYTLTCTMADHAMLGMRAQLRVRRAR